jgi:hypothetical protein
MLLAWGDFLFDGWAFGVLWRNTGVLRFAQNDEQQLLQQQIMASVSAGASEVAANTLKTTSPVTGSR